MTRFLRAATAALSVLLLVGPFALTARTQESPCPNVTVEGLWSTISAPPFTEAPTALAAYAVNPINPAELYATNGTQLWKSSNGGCDWKQVYSAGITPVELPDGAKPVQDALEGVAGARIVQIEIPETPAGLNRVYMLLEDRVGPAVRPRVLMSRDGGSTWSATEQGLPLTSGGTYGLHMAPGNMSILYLHLRTDPVNLNDDIYFSDDAGTTWTKHNGSSTASVDMTVDPIHPNEIWSWGGSGLFHSIDEGRTRSKIGYVAPQVGFVDVAHDAGKPSRIMAYEVETQSFGVSDDGGTTWTRMMGCPGFGLSIAHGADADQVVVSTHGNVCQFKPPEYWVTLSRPDFTNDLLDLSADRSSTPSIWGRTPNKIERYSGLGLKVTLPGVQAQIPEVDGTTTSLLPAKKTVRLKVGESQTVDYRFALPGHPTPLDVFFVVDTSSSMESSIAGLRAGMRSIIKELAEAKLDVQFGVGEFKDYPVPGFGSPGSGDVPYRLLRKIGPADDSLVDALAALESSGGGDQPESQLTALYQAATGYGEPGFVQPDQDAGFRTEALKVMVNITDAQFSDSPAHPSPAFNSVATELLNRKILQVGLSIYGINGPDGTPDLKEMAEATDTFAPSGGVDCDDDGRDDIAEGGALVCLITDFDGSGNMNLAPAIIATLEAVTSHVQVEMLTSEDKGFIAGLTPAVYPQVDITNRNQLGFSVTFQCTRPLAGSTRTIRLATRVDQVAAASAVAKVACKKLPKAARPKPEPPFIPPPAIVPVPAAIPAIAPAPPPPVIETVGTPQQIAQLQGAVMPQDQEQVQVAAAYNLAARQNDLAVQEEYEFSSYRENGGPGPAPLYLSAAALTLASGYAMAFRRSPAQARNRRRR